MKNTRIGLRFSLGALFGLCAADGILQVRGIRFLSPLWENTAVAVFFLLAGAALLLAWKARDHRALKRVRLWSGAVLLGSAALLLIMWAALLAEASPAVLTGFLYALAVVSTPVPCCSVLFWPVFAWAVLLVASHRLCRQINTTEKTE